MRRAAGILVAVVAALASAVPAWAASELFIRGAGYGHGVGMSQYGAYGYALAGRGYRSILAHYYSGTSLGTVDPNEVVTVLLATGSAAFSGAHRAGDKKLSPGKTYDVRPLAGGRLRLVTGTGKGKAKVAASFAAPLTVTGPGPLTLAGRGAYRGALEFRPTGSGRIQTINALGLDDYVRGVVASEMPSGWPTAALEAQAVAARTYAITTDAGGTAFDQYSDTRSQVYGGVGAETPSSDAAVAATRGQVVSDGGHPVVTYFFSSSGGQTENIENVFLGSAPEPWLRGVIDPYDGAGGNPRHRWRLELTAARAASKLGKFVDGGFVGVKVLRHGVSPRIVTAAVVGTRGTRRITGVELRKRFALLSTWAAFTTITTVARPYIAPPSARAGAAELAMPLALVRAVISRVAVLPDLVGTVFPARPRALIAVQKRAGGGWRTLRYARLLSGGSFAVAPPHHGVYRIVYDGLDGPAVAL
ncbi:MAG TPA: SpoIID/LytB domain-containing protein [Solirubrobacteraceae bacterium]|nr:SpoIID/LytB domain-containing protein [Solirubrobacteraceae bacterium]